MNWDGAIEKAEDADYMMSVEQNVGGNKFDYYVDNAIDMDIAIDGSSSHNLHRAKRLQRHVLPAAQLGDGRLGSSR